MATSDDSRLPCIYGNRRRVCAEPPWLLLQIQEISSNVPHSHHSQICFPSLSHGLLLGSPPQHERLNSPNSHLRRTLEYRFSFTRTLILSDAPEFRTSRALL